MGLHTYVDYSKLPENSLLGIWEAMNNQSEKRQQFLCLTTARFGKCIIAALLSLPGNYIIYICIILNFYVNVCILIIIKVVGRTSFKSLRKGGVEI